MSQLEEQVEQIFATVEELREVAGDGPGTRKLLESLFRTVHSLKARAAADGLNQPAAVAHEFENVLHSLRTGKTQLDESALQLLTATSDALFNSLATGKPQENSIPAEIWNSLKDEERHTLRQSVAEGAAIFLVQTDFDVADFDRQFQSLKEELNKRGEVISTAPKVDKERPGKINFRILYATTSLKLPEIPGVTAEEIRVPSLPHEAGRKGTPPKSDSVRINLEDLDRIISSTHKLFRQTTALLSSTTAGEAQSLERSFLKLSAELVNLRMVPLGRVLQRAVRAGRSTALATAKDVVFVVRGQDLLLDKSLCEAIEDPLVHLVRNAVDHGIERSEERSKLGKPLHGNITIEATTFQGQPKITVIDDGRGIDPEVVTNAAKRLGVLDQNAVVTADKCIRLLFRAGFSTAPGVSGTSGRGVGLDVVETGVEEVGGSVGVRSQLGKGSEFEIRLPLTFGLLDVVPITVSGQRYLVDAGHVVSQPQADNKHSGTIDLHTLLGQEHSENKPSAVLLCEFDKTRFALHVDEVGETQQALVRSLGSRSGRWFGVAGATELRDGTVILLLDLPRLISRRPA